MADGKVMHFQQIHRWSSSPAVGLVARGIDFLAISIAGYLALVFRFDVVGQFAVINNVYEYYPVIIGTAVAFVLLPGEMYASWRGARLSKMLMHVLVRWCLVIGLVLLWLFAFKASQDFSRIWFAAWVVVSGLVLVVARVGVYLLLRALRHYGFNHRHVALVGHGSGLMALKEQIDQASWTGYEIKETVEDLSLVSLECLAQRCFDEIWLALPVSNAGLVEEVLYGLRFSSASIRFVPDSFVSKLFKHGMTEVAGVTMFNLFTTPMTGTNQLLKYIEDKLLATLIVVLFSPIFMVLALAVKVSSPGPVFFVQERLGVGGKRIRVFKFRSMVVHQEPRGAMTQAVKNDARITPLGAFLRKTSLDELPQFFNVLAGDMSIVGPRPHAVSHNQQFMDVVDDYMLRHLVKPGITGWAQVNGYRGETDTLEKMQFRVRYDLYYIENWSLWLDIKIIFLTVFKGFVNKNAY